MSLYRASLHCLSITIVERHDSRSGTHDSANNTENDDADILGLDGSATILPKCDIMEECWRGVREARCAQRPDQALKQSESLSSEHRNGGGGRDDGEANSNTAAVAHKNRLGSRGSFVVQRRRAVLVADSLQLHLRGRRCVLDQQALRKLEDWDDLQRVREENADDEDNLNDEDDGCLAKVAKNNRGSIFTKGDKAKYTNNHENCSECGERNAKHERKLFAIAHTSLDRDDKTNTLECSGHLAKEEREIGEWGMGRTPIIVVGDEYDDRDEADEESGVGHDGEGPQRTDGGEHGDAGQDREWDQDEPTNC